MLGFTEEEVEKIIDDFGVGKIVDRNKFKEMLKEYTNDYRLSKKFKKNHV